MVSEVDTLRVTVQQLERDVAWKRRRARLLGTSLLVALASIPVLATWNAAFAKTHAMLVTGRGFLVTALVVSSLTVAVIVINHLAGTDSLGFRGTMYTAPDRYRYSLAQMRDSLASKREELRHKSLRVHPPLTERRSMYREGTAQVIDRYMRESRRYRRVHNSLQSLIMIGSTAATTIAALNPADWSWQSLSVVGIGFSVTLASAFTGYYKYRERSYFLRQTADAIEEELNALTLGIGDYRQFTDAEESEALAKFTQRVEALRNEQRRREQQLDQPADQAAPPTPPATS